MRFVDLFAGIGGFRFSAEKYGFNCVGFSEIDKNAIQTYRDNFGKCNSLGDIISLDTLPDNLDLVTGGVPCQSWSTAGKSKGFADDRGRLWFKVIKLLEISQPKMFVFENVSSMLNKDHIDSFKLIIERLEDIGYTVYFQKLNSNFFDTPQSRERIFIVGKLDKNFTYSFPEGKLNDKPLADFLPGLDNTSPGKIEKILFSDSRSAKTYIHSWELDYSDRREREIMDQVIKFGKRGKFENIPFTHEQFNEYFPCTLVELQFLVKAGYLKNPDISIIEREIKRGLIPPTNLNSENFIRRNNSCNFPLHNSRRISKILTPQSKFIHTLTRVTRGLAIAKKNYDSREDIIYDFIAHPDLFRELTKEDYRILQTFPDNFIHHEKDSISKQQFGNAITVKVVDKVIENLLK